MLRATLLLLGLAAGVHAVGPQVLADTGSFIGAFPSLASVGARPAVSYLDVINKDLLYVRAADSNGLAWATPVRVHEDGDVGAYSSLHIVDGSPAVAYHDMGNNALLYVGATDALGLGWNTPTVVDASWSGASHASLVTCSTGPCIAYSSFSEDTPADNFVAFTARVDGVWSARRVIDTAGSRDVTLVVLDGIPAVAYYVPSTGQVKFCAATSATGESWHAPTVLATAASVGDGSVVSLFAVAGFPMVTFQMNGIVTQLRSTTTAGGPWTQSSSTVERSSSIPAELAATVVAGRAFAAWYDVQTHSIRSATALNADATVWASPVHLAFTDPAPHLSVADVNSYPAVAYYDQATRNLKFMFAEYPSPSPSPTPSSTPSTSMSSTRSSSETTTPTPSASLSSTASITATPSPSLSATPSASASVTVTMSTTLSSSPSTTVLPALTPSTSSAPTPSVTPSPTSSPSSSPAVGVGIMRLRTSSSNSRSPFPAALVSGVAGGALLVGIATAYFIYRRRSRGGDSTVTKLQSRGDGKATRRASQQDDDVSLATATLAASALRRASVDLGDPQRRASLSSGTGSSMGRGTPSPLVPAQYRGSVRSTPVTLVPFSGAPATAAYTVDLDSATQTAGSAASSATPVKAVDRDRDTPPMPGTYSAAASYALSSSPAPGPAPTTLSSSPAPVAQASHLPPRDTAPSRSSADGRTSVSALERLKIMHGRSTTPGAGIRSPSASSRPPSHAAAGEGDGRSTTPGLGPVTLRGVRPASLTAVKSWSTKAYNAIVAGRPSSTTEEPNAPPVVIGAPIAVERGLSFSNSFRLTPSHRASASTASIDEDDLQIDVHIAEENV